MIKALTILTAALAASLSTAAVAAPGAGMTGLPFREAMVQAHNAARARYGLAPLAWSDELAAEAAGRAALIARMADPLSAHERGEAGGGKPRGENLWLGTRGAFSFDEMAQGWLEEQADFVNGVFPRVSRTGDWADVGHYTQMIWPATAHVGCAIASNAEFDLLICRYDPPGNVMGRQVLSGRAIAAR